MENVWKVVVAVSGSVASFLWGGWSALLLILFAAVVIDFVTGWMAAAAEGKLKSKISYRGAFKKVAVFLVVALAHMADTALGYGHLLRDAAIWFYLANEALSIIENCGRLGLPVPSVLKKAVEVLKEKGDVKNG